MDNLPVKLLTDLISPEEIIEAGQVRYTHQVEYCPVGISLSGESYVALKCHCYSEGKQFSEFRYTPRACFAVKVWENARDNLLKRPEFAGALDIEWYPVAASFRSVRFVNGGTERFIAAMFEEMKRTADSHTIEIRYGRFDLPALPTLPDYPRRYYIMPQKLLAEKRGYAMQDEIKPLQNVPAGTFSWKDIEDAFVILKPIQLAFIAGDEMNRHTPLDEEFLQACHDFDFGKVKELVAKGANIHAAEGYGDTAMVEMMSGYDLDASNHYKRCRSRKKKRARFIELAQYLFSLGYNINIAGYAATSCLYEAPHMDDLEIVKFLLDNGADPNIGSYIGDGGEILGTTVLMHVWDDVAVFDDWNYMELIRLLLKYGALPVARGETFTEEELDRWIEKQKADKQWDIGLCSGLSKRDSALVNCARNMLCYDMALIAQTGGNIDVRDSRGRNLLQIMLEDAGPVEKNYPPYYQDGLEEMALILLCGLKLKLSDEEIERAKAACREKGYFEVLADIEPDKTGRTKPRLQN